MVLRRTRDLGVIPVVCGILSRRPAGARRRFDAFAMNSLLASHCRRNGTLFVDNWTRFYGKEHLYVRDGVHSLLGGGGFGLEIKK